MKRTGVWFGIVIAVVAGRTCAAVADDRGSPPPVAKTEGTGDLAVCIDAIRRAPDPSAAVAAYAGALAVVHGSLLPEEAYVHRMLELGMPAMAYVQARV